MCFRNYDLTNTASSSAINFVLFLKHIDSLEDSDQGKKIPKTFVDSHSWLVMHKKTPAQRNFHETFTNGIYFSQGKMKMLPVFFSDDIPT